VCGARGFGLSPPGADQHGAARGGGSEGQPAGTLPAWAALASAEPLYASPGMLGAKCLRPIFIYLKS